MVDDITVDHLGVLQIRVSSWRLSYAGFMRGLFTLMILPLLAACGREEPTPATSALGPAETTEPQPVVLGLTSPDLEPIPAEPGQRVAAAQVMVAEDGDLVLEEADADHDGVLDDREPAPSTEPPPPPPEDKQSDASAPAGPQPDSAER